MNIILWSWVGWEIGVIFCYTSHCNEAGKCYTRMKYTFALVRAISLTLHNVRKGTILNQAYLIDHYLHSHCPFMSLA